MKLNLENLYINHKYQLEAHYLDSEKERKITNNDSELSQIEMIDYYLALFNILNHNPELEEVVIDNILINGFRIGLKREKNKYYYELIGGFFSDDFYFKIDQLFGALQGRKKHKYIKIVWKKAHSYSPHKQLEDGYGFQVDHNRPDLLLDLIEKTKLLGIIGSEPKDLDRVLKKVN